MEVKEVQFKKEESKLNFIVILTDELKSLFSKAYQKLSKELNLAGFRRGHLPNQVINLYFRPQLQNAVLQEALECIHKEVFSNKELKEYKFVGNLQIKVNKFTEYEIEFSVDVEVEPKLDIEIYKNIELKSKRISYPTKEEIEEALKNLQKEYAIFHPVDEEYESKEGDLVEFRLNSYHKGRLVNSQIKEVVLGTNQIPYEIEKNIIGMKKKEKKHFFTRIPQELHTSALGGEEIEVEVEILNLWREELLPQDREFAKDLGFDSISELKDDIKERIKKKKQEEENKCLKDKLAEELVNRYEFCPPKSLIDKEVEYLRLSLLYNLSILGVSKEAYLHYRNMKEEELKEELEKKAAFRTKLAIILDNIAKKENISADDSELEEFIEDSFSSLADRSIAKSNPNYREMLKKELIQKKTLDFLIKNIKISYE